MTDEDRRDVLARLNGPEHTHGGAPAKNPCGTCPYRKDVPAGVWAAEEYDKLPAFDLPTEEQPLAVFFCHQQNSRLCAGWCGTHDMDNSLGLRVAPAFGSITPEAADEARQYVSPIPLWESGAAAAEYGKSGIDSPDARARKAVEKVEKRQQRMAAQAVNYRA